MKEIDVNQMSPLVWAYIGDSVYEQYIRNYLVTNTKYKPHKLHIEATKFVKASAQAEVLKKLEDILTQIHFNCQSTLIVFIDISKISFNLSNCFVKCKYPINPSNAVAYI